MAMKTKLFHHDRIKENYFFMSISEPIPANELDRILNLSEFDIDYSNYNDQF